MCTSQVRPARAALPARGGTSRCQATNMVVQGARERMFCHVAPIRMPCSRSLACCPVDLNLHEAEMNAPVFGHIVGSAGLGGGWLAGRS